MELASVRALKREALESLVGPLALNEIRARAFSVPAGSLKRALPSAPAAALGIARGDGRKDFRLAVRLQLRSMELQPDLRDRLETLTKGEVDLRYIGRVSKQDPSWHTSRQRPLLMGASVGHFSVTAGSMGAFPMARKTGKRVLLSNNHVLANENQAKIGDAILQAGVIDGGLKGADAIGTLLDFVPLKQTGANLIDAAVASIDPAITADTTTLTGSGVLKGMRSRPLDIDDRVFKLGRTTGLTRGVVTAIEVDDVVVDYEIGSLRFDRQTEIEGDGNAAFSEGGDSGALVVDADGLASGLLFAGTDQGGANGRGLSYVSDLSLVMDALDLVLEV